MSTDQAEILNEIKGKIQAVRDRLHEQNDANTVLREQNEELQQVVQNKQSQIEELEEKNQKLALARSILADSEDAVDAKVRINKIVREIDKCIALLNR